MDERIIEAIDRMRADVRGDLRELDGKVDELTILVASSGVKADALRERLDTHQAACLRRHQRIDRAGWAVIAGIVTTAGAVIGRLIGVY